VKYKSEKQVEAEDTYRIKTVENENTAESIHI